MWLWGAGGGGGGVCVCVLSEGGEGRGMVREGCGTGNRIGLMSRRGNEGADRWMEEGWRMGVAGSGGRGRRLSEERSSTGPPL